MKILKSIIYPLAFALGTVVLFSCGSATSKDKVDKQTQAEIDSLQKEKQELTEILEEEKRQIDKQIADLKEKKAKTTEKKAQDFYDESINRLNKTNDSLDARMQRFEKETEKDWQQLKKEMNEAFES